jgi:ADP-dependent NAD(P)H-hydrate dehydratase
MPTRIHALRSLPERPADGHKGTFGRVLVIGGNAEMIGAPAFAGASAFRSGAGVVQIATPKSTLALSLSVEPELIGLALPAPKKKWEDATTKADAIVIGPGLGQLGEAKKMIDAVLKLDKPVVIDADGLNILSAQKRWPAKVRARCVLTPHPGEMRRLGKLFGKTEQEQTPGDRLDTATCSAEAFNHVVVLKGARTIVTDADRYYINITGDTSLSKAGTGDILTGICATLLAQQFDPFDAACTAVWIHGKAGEIAGKRLTPRSTTARDIIASIGEAFLAYQQTFGTA